MSAPLENTVAESVLRTPKIPGSEVPLLDSKTLITKLLDANLGKQWHAFTPIAIAAIHSILVANCVPRKNRKVLRKQVHAIGLSQNLQLTDPQFKRSINVKQLHKTLSNRLSNVPDYDCFCETLGIRQEAIPAVPARKGSSLETVDAQDRLVLSGKPTTASKAKQPKLGQGRQGNRKRNSSQVPGPLEPGVSTSEVMPTYEDRDLLVTAPNKGAHFSTYSTGTRIRVNMPDGPLSYTFTTELSQPPKLHLRFPNTMIRDMACYTLKAHSFKIGEGPIFQLNVQYPWLSKKENVMWILEVVSKKLGYLLEIIDLFLPHHQHCPIYTIDHGSEGQATGALRVELPFPVDTHPALREEMAAAESTSGVKDWYLTAACSEGCGPLTHKILPVDIRDPRNKR
ncbi:MAG: hypothetical protein LQ346_003351 [Caloplaca aetnensis]|nr:MAG: hypothetical protein LQ346_003351 [Caloplaca aetnensis]